MVNPKLSIITVVRNGERTLQKTIESVINQTYKEIEYIIIDGASTDSTIDIIGKYSSYIYCTISEPDNGIYDAMNKGLNKSTGDFIWFLNSGDCIHSKEVVEGIFKNRESVDFYYGRSNLIFEDGRVKKTTTIPHNLNIMSMVAGMVVSHQGVIVSRKIACQYSLKYRYVSDLDWIINILRKAKKVKAIDGVVVDYLIGGFSDKNYCNCWKERLDIIKTQYGLYELFINYLLFAKDSLKKLIKILLGLA